MKTESFAKSTTEDLIFDKDFRELVQNPKYADDLNELLESNPEKRYEINLAIEIIQGLHVEKFHQSDNRKNELWLQIATKQRKRIQFNLLKYAAAIILFVGAGSLLYFSRSTTNDSHLAVSDPDSSEDFVNNESDALLILSDGITVPISTKESTIEYSADGSQIKVNSTRAVDQSKGNGGLNKMIVPYGKRSTITLSDGTKVALNSGSTLIFPPVFDGNAREVQLMGEGFFDVTHDKVKPFYVLTDAFKMKVYGTKFNIQAYKQDNASCVILVEGKVSIQNHQGSQDSEVFLAPNQRGIVVDGSNNVQIEDVENVEMYTSWTEGYLTFADEDITRLIKQISRYYNVDIEIATTNKLDKIYGKLDLKEDIEKVLDGISFISNTRYRKIGNKYEIYQ
jgi:ferric-dicitrate binding protein FerR (iron transport regulator)